VTQDQQSSGSGAARWASSAWAVAGLLLLIGFAGAIAGPKFGAIQQREARAEVPRNLDAIRLAELAYYEEAGSFVAVPRTPTEMPASGPADWPENTVFDTIDWRPHEATSGVYWVVVTDEGANFEVHGLIDADGDGVPAHYVANRAERAWMLSANNIY